MVWLYVLNMHGYLIYMHWNWYIWYEYGMEMLIGGVIA